MITINYQTYGNSGFHLRLRLYQNGETRYINVTKMLKGDILKRHWIAENQKFSPNAPYAEDNNRVLAKFKERYETTAKDWEGTLAGFLLSLEEIRVEQEKTLENFYAYLVEKCKKNLHEDGTIKGTFEEYQKVEKRVKEFCKSKNIEYSKLLLKEVTPGFINNILNWVEEERKGVGLRYISKGLHSLIGKADKQGYLNAEDFKRCRWFKDNPLSSQKFNTLTDKDIEMFKNLYLPDISKSCFNEFYRDVCLFVLHTGQSICDVLALRDCNRVNIQGNPYFVFKRRKISQKQKVPCMVPISAEMEAIISKWKWCSKDGYVFPIRNLRKLRTQTTNNGDIKHFIANINNWLKKIGKALGLTFDLRTYTFRHTAITRYVSQNIPLPYISNMMGTSVENIEQVYYNNLGDTKSMHKVLSAMQQLGA